MVEPLLLGAGLSSVTTYLSLYAVQRLGFPLVELDLLDARRRALKA